ncbi:hypothetical protein [Pseudoalteromonas luteoviolacea]|uniref:Uncharacterized protein n=1 Tax=Pseudoalteromonas luteoviolacea S4060-1 TaxID=1365257 RepID=A0A162BC14_9GAMM|nr:hypothetical protein [Pseudoalteromonas luteoviolacea]KZN70332.1 hypothetical protein N478_00080 [Pseudoalteromonas luteoviolacea S4060-1]
MASFIEQMTNAGFSYVDKKKQSLKKEFFPGYVWEVTLIDESWDELYEVAFYVWSPLFGKLMINLFSDYEAIVSSYHSRILEKNEKGCLSFSSISWDEGPSGDMELYAAGTYLNLNEFLKSLSSVNAPDDVYSLIYEGVASKFAPPSELLWVYLYLLKEMGLSNLEILDKLASEQENFPAKTLKPVDLTLLEAFEVSYNKARGQ